MFVSVYIPTHNRKDSVQKAIDSIVAQTHDNWELIVVDDASQDDTPQLLESYSKADKRIKFFRNETPLGAPRARNRAISAAQGDFVTGLDDDDTFHPDRLRAFCEYWTILSRSNEALSGIYTQESGIIRGVEAYETRKPSRTSFRDLAEVNSIGNQIFAPKSHYTEVGMFDETMPAWQDLELFMRITKKFGDARLLDAKLYNFDVTPSDNRISSKEPRIREAYQKVVKAHFPDDKRAQQLLTLQVFSHYYGFKPKRGDLVKFMQLGLWPRGYVKMLRASVA